MTKRCGELTMTLPGAWGGSRFRVMGLTCSLALASCGGAVHGQDSPDAHRGGPVAFEFHGPGNARLTSQETRGYVTVILFGTTYDLATQVEAKLLERTSRTHRPRIRAGLVVLESSEYAPLAEAFRAAMNLSYPVNLADAETRAGESAFGTLDRVPTLVILDPNGRQVWRREGLASPAEIQRGIEEAEKSDVAVGQD